MRTYNHSTECPGIPRATYRLQLNNGFTLKDAKKLIPYLNKLGVSHVYSSPLLRARSGSPHCYDVVSHTELNREIASEKEFEEFCKLLSKNKMGLLLDIVPNHMSTSPENKLWFDVLEKGINSKYANYFDIDWNASLSKHRVILPILGSRLSDVLRSGNLKLFSDLDNRKNPICLEVYGTKLPISIESYIFILKQLNESKWSMRVVREIVEYLKTEEIDSRNLGKLKTEIATTLTEPEITRSFHKLLRTINANVRKTPDWKIFHDFLALQHYLLEYWRDAMKKVNYRRFVYVNDLAAICVEDQSVFEESHALVRDWIKRGLVNALRVDHVDGLKDPAQYLERLQELFSTKTKNHRIKPYVVIEKILLGEEKLRMDWKVSGTTGYDFTKRMNGLFVAKQNQKAFESIYNNFSKTSESLEEVSLDSKRMIVRRFTRPDVDRLIRLVRSYKLPKRFENVSGSDLRSVIEELAVHFPVYRTYVASTITSDDRSILEEALRETAKRVGAKKKTTVNLLRHLFLSTGARDNPRYKEFCLRFQQLTPTILAKGLEDTASYRYFPLSSLNEVGGDPSEFGVTVEEFHSKNVKIAKNWPNTMLASSTHDTKWSEDSRARLDVLSELPEEWNIAINRWSRKNLRFKTRVGTKLFPTRNDEYLLYEALLATLPDCPNSISKEFVDRIASYMRKASKEEKRETGWIGSNPVYDIALERFVRKVLEFKNHELLDDLNHILSKVRTCGFYNSLSQLLLKLTCPGVPDIYQGCETWNIRMVDPDNRSPVDFDVLINNLRSITRDTNSHNLAKSLFSQYENGLIKMYLVKSILGFRKRNEDLFNFGEYIPIKTSGKFASNTVSFARKYKSSRIIIVVSRFFSKICEVNSLPIGDAWKGTYSKLPVTLRGKYTNIFNGERILIGEENDYQLKLELAFSSLPFCLLSSQSA